MTNAVADRPIRVVMFGTGPVLTHDAKLFLSRLEQHPQIVLVGAICQADSASQTAFVRDLWQRRRWLAVPLLAIWVLRGLSRYLFHPRAVRALDKTMARLADRIHFVRDIHAPEVLAMLRQMAPDLGLVYGSPILKPALFDIPTLGTLGIHHGKAPQYRGNKTTFWAMYNGEKTAGVIIQKINAGLDTGEIIEEGEVVINGRSRQSVWQELEALGLDLYIQAILAIKEGTAVYRPQTGPKGKLYKNPTFTDLLRFWGRQWKRRWQRLKKPVASRQGRK